MTMSLRLPLSLTVFASALALSPTAVLAQAAPAAAQAPAKQFVPGLAIADRDQIITNSKAFRTAGSERQIVYKNQLAMVESRRKQINAQLEPLVKKFKEDQANGSATEAELQLQLQTIQNLQNSGVQELNTMLAPVRLSEAYVNEQVGDAVSKAIVNAMDKNGITVVVPPQNLLAFNNAYNLTPAAIAELDVLLPNAGVVPPDGWRPRAEREAAAAQQAQLGTPAPTRPARSGR